MILFIYLFCFALYQKRFPCCDWKYFPMTYFFTFWWVLTSSSRQLVTRQEDIASSYTRGGSVWIWERISLWKGLLNIGMGCQWCSHHPWSFVRNDWTWHLVPWPFWRGGVWFKVGLDLRGPFHSKKFCDSSNIISSFMMRVRFFPSLHAYATLYNFSVIFSYSGPLFVEFRNWK